MADAVGARCLCLKGRNLRSVRFRGGWEMLLESEPKEKKKISFWRLIDVAMRSLYVLVLAGVLHA